MLKFSNVFFLYLYLIFPLSCRLAVDKINNLDNALETFNMEMFYNENEGKIIINSSEKEHYQKGDMVLIEAIPEAGYYFSNWNVNGVDLYDNPYTITMDDNKKIIACFNENPPSTYTLTKSVSGTGGSISGGNGNPYDEGSSVTITAIPNSGYSFSEWTVNGSVMSDNPLTIVMDGNKTVVAYFIVDNTPKIGFVFVDTYGKQILDEPKIDAHMKIYTTANNSLPFLEPDTTVKVLDEKIGIEIRGYSSTEFPKKQFGFETWDASKNDKKVSILGLPEESDWILSAPYDDKSLVRNQLGYTLFSQMGHYVTRTKFLELYLDTNSNTSFFPGDLNQYYQGVYMLLEKIKRDKNRVNIEKLLPADTSEPIISGGYIIKIDHIDSDEDCFYINRNDACERVNHVPGDTRIRIIYVYPKQDAINTAQKNYIKKYMNDFANALAGSGFKDPNTGYAKYIDSSTFIDYFLLQELFRNYDGYTASCFMHKDRGGKLKMGPVWDLNETISNINVDAAYKPWATSGWLFNNPREWGSLPFWWGRLLEDPAYKSKLVYRWIHLRNTVFSNNNINSIIDDATDLLSEAQGRNFDKWDILYESVCSWLNYYHGTSGGVWNRSDAFINTLPGYPSFNGYSSEVLLVKKWLEERLGWIDNNIEDL